MKPEGYSEMVLEIISSDEMRCEIRLSLAYIVCISFFKNIVQKSNQGIG